MIAAIGGGDVAIQNQGLRLCITGCLHDIGSAIAIQIDRKKQIVSAKDVTGLYRLRYGETVAV